MSFSLVRWAGTCGSNYLRFDWFDFWQHQKTSDLKNMRENICGVVGTQMKRTRKKSTWEQQDLLAFLYIEMARKKRVNTLSIVGFFS